jgi:ribosomal protein S18 acetylase RimI-like enzyme
MNYRLFEPEDFDELYEIEEVCFQPPLRFSRRYMRQLIASPNAATWIAESNEHLSGFGIVDWSEQSVGVFAYIQTIEIAPHYRGHGIGSELMRRLEGSANAEGAVAIWLHVDETNTAAIQLYRAHGYQHTGRTENYYTRGRAADIYIKHLKPATDK